MSTATLYAPTVQQVLHFAYGREGRGGPGNLNNWDKWISCSVGA